MITLAAIVVCNPAQAVSFLTFDARSMSMGGTGVVTARSHNASLFNPGLLLSQDRKRRSRVHGHAYLGIRLLDRDNFLDRADAFSKRYEGVSLKDLVEDSVTLESAGFSTGNQLRRTTGRVRELQADINDLSDKPLRVSASYGAAFNYPGRQWAFGGYHRQYLVLGSVVRVADEDNANIDRVTNTVDRFADLFDAVAALEDLQRPIEELTLADVVARAERIWKAAEALDEYVDFDELYGDARADNLRGRDLEDYLREPLPTEFYSTIESQGAEVTEQALSIARRFELNQRHGLQVGLNLKQVHFTTIHFEQRVDDFDLDAYEDEVYRRASSRFNMDAGIVHDLPNAWEWGFVVRNLIPHDFYTVRGEQVSVRPVARVGVGYRTQPLRLSMDLDITKNEPLGFDPDKQYLSLGAEWFLWRNTALRAGLRGNLVDGETLPSLGLGLGGHQGHVDVALAKSANGDEWGVSLQAGLSFP